MALTTLQENLDFCNVQKDYVEINAGNHTIIFTYDSGSNTTITLDNNTYLPDDLMTNLTSKLNTAFSITSTCTYSSSTRKVTIAVAASHTIQLIVSGSSGALLLGFTSNSSNTQSITGDSTIGSDPTAIITTIKNGVEALAKKYCNRTLEASQTYTNRRYDGTGTNYLILDHYPIITLTKLATSTIDIMRIRNTNDHTTASVSVTSTGLNLERNGTTDSTVTFATNDILSEVVTAVNAISGWEAIIQSSDYNSYISSELLESFGLNCIDDNWIYLKCTDDAEDDFHIDADKGIIYLPYNFPTGERNIYVSYTAYSAIADDLTLAILIWVKYMYSKQQEDSWGMASYRVGSLNASYRDYAMPIETKLILDKYKRMKI